MSALLHATLVHLREGRWTEAHNLVQTDESPLGHWLHGIVHIQEGDLEDAEYWYDKAGQHFRSRGTLAQEMDRFTAALNAQSAQAIIREAAQGSLEGRLHFGLSQGGVVTLDLDTSGLAVAEAFDGPGVKAAIQGAQQGVVKYPEFMRLTCQAGCIGYTVWITGRHVSYYGRKGESHVEHFPS